MLDNNRLVGKLDACEIKFMVADCGNKDLGCPDCESETMEVSCPCCTSCCYDGDQECNLDDWLSQIKQGWRDMYDLDGYSFASGEVFVPAD